MKGKVRFIVVGEGAILESVASMSPLKLTDVPGKGFLATIRCVCVCDETDGKRIEVDKGVKLDQVI